MAQIVGAALVSHHPGLMQSDDFRVKMGDGADSDLIAGYQRLRDRIDVVRPDTFVLFDTHWFTTGYHLIDGGAHMHGTYTSDEMPCTCMASTMTTADRLRSPASSKRSRWNRA